MTDPLILDEGMHVLHLFAKVTDRSDRANLQAAFKVATEDSVQVVPIAILGHKCDMGIMGIASDVRKLRSLQTGVEQSGLELTYSYLSVTEVSEYASGVPDAMKQARLYPDLPPEGKRAFCFYPMSKRRGEIDNWYSLDYEQRESLMMGHGKVGRTFAGRVVQLVTASTGLDDYEWGVSLFATSMDALKDCVYSMRFDPASAKYAEFGPFYTGYIVSAEEVADEVGLES